MKISVFLHHIACAARERGMTVDDMMAQARAWGIDYVELDRDDVGTTDEEILALGSRLARHGLKPSSIYGFYGWDHDGALPREDDLLLRQARLLGCGRIMIIPGFYSDVTDAEKCRQEKAQMIAGTRRLTELALRQGLDATIECFDSGTSPIVTISGMAEFLEAIPQLGVTLETGNFLFSGDDILEAQQRFRPRVRHVHLKDRYLPHLAEGGAPAERLTGDPATGTTGVVMYPCAVGYGHIPMAAVLEELACWGYDGIMTIEHFGAGSYWAAIRDSAAWLKEKLNACL